jgi:drug/metabolite transporter (DMT)-like permease
MPWRTVVAFATLVALVGTNLVAIRFTNRELAPFWNAGARFALAAAIFGLIAAARKTARPSASAVRGSILYGLLAFAGFFAFIYTGLLHAPAALGQTVLAVGPLMTLLLAGTLGLETIRGRAIVGSTLALVGIGIAFGAQEHLDVPLASLAALAAAAASFALGSLVAKRLPAVDPVMQNAIATATGAVVLLPLSLLAGESWSLPRDPETWLGFGYLVLPGTIVIFLLFLYLLRRLPASVVSYQFVLAPIVSITLGTLLLGETVGPGTVVGAVVVGLGVYIGALAPGGSGTTG